MRFLLSIRRFLYEEKECIKGLRLRIWKTYVVNFNTNIISSWERLEVKNIIHKGKYFFVLTLHCRRYLALERESIMQKLYVPDLYQVFIREHFYWGCGHREDTRVFGEVKCSSVERYQTFRSNQLPACPCLHQSTRRPISVGITADGRPCPCACQLPKTIYRMFLNEALLPNITYWKLQPCMCRN